MYPFKNHTPCRYCPEGTIVQCGFCQLCPDCGTVVYVTKMAVPFSFLDLGDTFYSVFDDETLFEKVADIVCSDVRGLIQAVAPGSLVVPSHYALMGDAFSLN